jgi:hypothetical protein
MNGLRLFAAFRGRTRPEPSSLMQPAIPAGWAIAPLVVFRLRRTTAPL